MFLFLGNTVLHSYISLILISNAQWSHYWKIEWNRKKLSSWGGILQHLSNNGFGHKTQRIEKSAQKKRLLMVLSANHIFTSDVNMENPFRQKRCLFPSAEWLDNTVKNSDYIAFNDRKSNYRVQKDMEWSGCSLLCGIILAFAGRD